MLSSSMQLNCRQAPCFVDDEWLASQHGLNKVLAIPRYGRVSGSVSAAVTAGCLHGAIMLWLQALPAPPPRTAAVPLPTIAVELAAPAAKDVKPAEVVPPPPKPPEQKQKIKPVNKAKAKPLVKEAMTEKSEPAPEPDISAPQPQAASPQVSNTQAQASPAEESYIPPRSNLAYLNNPKPVYPLDARQRHQEGLVVIKVFVSAEGMAQTVRIERSSGHDILDESALTAVREWRFVPAKRGERPEAGWATVPINFSLS